MDDVNKYGLYDSGRVRLVETAGIAVTGGTVSNIFTVVNGIVAILCLLGEVVTAVSANACNMKLVADPVSGIDTDMCTVVDIQSAAIGDIFYIDGTVGNAMVKAVPGTALPLAIGMDVPLCLPAGTVDLNLANSDPTTGVITWYMRYAAVQAGAYVIGA
jgi:hypothetical protein